MDGRGYFLTQELQNLGELGLSRFCKNELSSMGTNDIPQEEGYGIADLRHEGILAEIQRSTKHPPKERRVKYR